MPPDMKYDMDSETPAFVSADQELRIVKDSLIIVKIVGIRPAANEIVRNFHIIHNRKLIYSLFNAVSCRHHQRRLSRPR